MHPNTRKKYIIETYCDFILELFERGLNILNDEEYPPKTYTKKELLIINDIG